MSAVRSSSRGRRSGAGAPALPLAEARARAGAAATAINAQSFAVFTVSSGAERQLVCRLEGERAGTAAFLAAFQLSVGSEVARHALASSAPFWWEGSARTCNAASVLSALRWVVRSTTSALPQPGVGFPCATESGECGAFAFWGTELRLEADGFYEFHARLCPLFELVVHSTSQGGEEIPHMSRRELECLRLAAKGGTSEEIAVQLGLSKHTTEQYLTAAGGKLNAVNRAHALAKAIRFGLID